MNTYCKCKELRSVILAYFGEVATEQVEKLVKGDFYDLPHLKGIQPCELDQYQMEELGFRRVHGSDEFLIPAWMYSFLASPLRIFENGEIAERTHPILKITTHDGYLTYTVIPSDVTTLPTERQVTI